MRSSLAASLLLLGIACGGPCASDTEAPPPEDPSFRATGDLPYDFAQRYCIAIPRCDAEFFDRYYQGFDDCVALATDIASESGCSTDPLTWQPLLEALRGDCAVFDYTRAPTLLLQEHGVCS